MKLSAILLLAGALQVSASSYSQQVSLNLKEVPLEHVFRAIQQQTGYSFSYNDRLMKDTKPVTIQVNNVPLDEALQICFRSQPVTYSIVDRIIAVKPVAKIESGVNPAPPVEVALIVYNDEGEVLAGASVYLRQSGKERALQGVTDARGVFKLRGLQVGSYTVEFSYIGYVGLSREIKVGEKSIVLGFVLRRSQNALDAIQLTAYSKTTARFNTGDITTVTAEEIARNPVPNVLQSLQGRVPGLFVTQETGLPNSGFQVQVRSLNTLSGGGVSPYPQFISQGGQPMYIVDGVEYPANAPLPQVTFGFGNSNAELYGNVLNYLDPSLIESINILKGADATSIYGSRGAFGVILITTKKAKAGKPSVTINAVQGFSSLGVSAKLLGLKDYLALRENAFANDGTKPGPYDLDVNGVWDTTKATDWKKFYLGGHAPVTRINATYSGGTLNSNFLLGANYSSQGNIQRAKGSVRQGGMNFSINTATNDRKLTMALSGSYTTNLDNTVPVDVSGTGGINQAPDGPNPYLPNGQLNWAYGINALAALNSLHTNHTDNLIANTTFTYTPVTGLSFTAAGGYSLQSAKEFVGAPSSYFNPANFTPDLAVSVLNLYRIRIISADPRAGYEHTWGKAHLDVIAGGSIRDQLNTQARIRGSGFATDELLLDPAAATNTSAIYSETPRKYIGVFTAVNFRWADKYILNLNGRRDGSSVFGNARQFGNFGSVAGAWIISEERWFKGLRKVVDFFKLKASYGLVGGSAIPPYQYINTYSSSSDNYEGGLGLYPQNLANPYLHWETNRNFEAGANIDLFGGRINIDATYYTDKVGDQLTSQGLAGITGFNSFLVNTPALIRSYGAEFLVTTKNIQSKNFSWTTRINATIPRTRLLAFPGLGTLVNNVNYIIGKPITGIKLYRFAGVDPATGVYNFYNAAGQKGEYTPYFSATQLNTNTDRTEFVDRAPRWYGGVLNTVSYKNFGLDFLITVTKRIGPGYEAFQFTPPGLYNSNVAVDIANRRWMKPGDVTTVPKASSGVAGILDQNNFLLSSGAYTDATYARLQNLSLIYRLPAGLIQRMHMTNLSVYVAGQNLLTVSKFKGLDPENLLGNHIPPLRVFTGGINVGF